MSGVVFSSDDAVGVDAEETFEGDDAVDGESFVGVLLEDEDAVAGAGGEAEAEAD